MTTFTKAQGKQLNYYLKTRKDYKDQSFESILNDGGLLFEPQLVQTEYTFGGIKYPSRSHSVIRTDTHQEIGDGFKQGMNPVSYLKSFSGAHEIITKSGYVPVNTYFLDNGSKGGVIYSKEGDNEESIRGHKINNLIRLNNGFDGKIVLNIDSFMFELVCSNGMSRVTDYQSNGLKHTKSLEDNLYKLPKEISSLEFAYQEFISTMNKWAEIPASNNLVSKFLNYLLPDKEVKKGEKINSARANKRQEISNEIARQAMIRGDKEIFVSHLLEGVTGYVTFNISNRSEADQFEYILTNKMPAQAYSFIEGQYGK